MSTLGTMKARIRRETRRGSTIDADISDCIGDAIKAYRDKRFWWAESRTQAAFNTAALQEFYGEADDEALGRLITIDWVVITVGAMPYQLARTRPLEGDLHPSTTFGQPFQYSWYEGQLRFYPIPAGVYAARVAGLFSAKAPATDEEAGNPWMTHGERLIRSRAKLELALHRIKDAKMAEDMALATEEALSQLISETTSKAETGQVVPFV